MGKQEILLTLVLNGAVSASWRKKSFLVVLKFVTQINYLPS
jgi:hypothetical protein